MHECINCGKLFPTCGKCMWKSGKHMENYAKGRNAQKYTSFLSKR
jgi:predicted  nucleic acid-binding Zn-ribbon protein